MGIHRAIRQAGGSNEELTATLAATASLSKAATWELRRPIDEGHLFEGRELGRVLWSHTETFSQVSSIPAEMLQSGTEPPLAVETRARLFSIAHNALTNAFLHAHGPAGSRSGWTSGPAASGCPSRTTGSACPKTTPNAAGDSGA